MIDIRLDDVEKHRLESLVEQAWWWATVWEAQGDRTQAEKCLTIAAEREKDLVAFQRAQMDKMIDWW